jgi:hypothetical protein
MIQKYSRSEIKEGMKIKSREQLSNIYDTWIILVRKPEEREYTIGFIGEKTDSRSDALYTAGNIICPVYNDSMDIAGEVYYEE